MLETSSHQTPIGAIIFPFIVSRYHFVSDFAQKKNNIFLHGLIGIDWWLVIKSSTNEQKKL